MVSTSIIVAGSRSIESYAYFRQVLLEHIKQHHDIRSVEIVTGRANGVDDMAYHFARWDQNLPFKEFPADWDKYGKSAGYRRNVEMSKYADELVLFWDGVSKGSLHMLTIMATKGPTYLYIVDPKQHNETFELIHYST